MQQPQPPRQYSGHGTSSAFSSSANPGEDWTKISDLAERRRIQNRIAQRNYRKKLKKRLEDLERRAGTSDDSSSPGTEKTSPVQKRKLYDLEVDCEPEMDNETISGRCRDIRQQLTDLLATLENGSAQVSTTVTSSSIKDVLERFMLWAGNLGALRKPASKLSLDSRLAGSSDLRDYICTELEDMSEAIEDLINIVNGSTPNREIGYSSGSESDLDMESDESSSSNDPVDEAGSILQVISQGITSLLKIGILVRQPASSGTDRFHRASRDSTNAFLDRFDIDYVQHKHPKLGAGDQSSRMGKAIAKRRQFIRYCRDHKSNLAAEENEGKDTSNPQIGSQKATTAKQSSKATTFVAKENLMDILQGSVDVLEEEEDAASHCSVSTTSESLAILKLPRLADLSPDDDPFECPICYTLQQFRSEQSWRRHAYRDLKSYVCTVGGTECDDKFFDDRTSWFNHELEQHRSGYVCVLCGANDGKNKRTRSLLRRHILSAHGDFESDQLERLEDAGRDTATTLKAKDCPFCDDWSELIARKIPPGKTAQPGDDFVVSTSRFKKHVAMHLEQLAIFALPRHEHDNDMDEDGSHGSDSRVMDSRSSESFAGSFGSEKERFNEEHQSDQAPSVGEGSTAHAGSETENAPTTAPEEEIDSEMEELKQELRGTLLEEFHPEEERKEEEEEKSKERAERERNAMLDYQVQLMLLEQQNKKRITMARSMMENEEEEDKKTGTMGSFSSKASTSTSKKHKCKVCDKRFTRPSSLQTHMYNHTGEKPFHCEVEGCGRQFSVVSNLRRHKKVHKNQSDLVTQEEEEEEVEKERNEKEHQRRLQEDLPNQFRFDEKDIAAILKKDKMVLKDKRRPVQPLDDERHHHDDQTTRTKSPDRTSNEKAYYGYAEEFDEHQPGPVEGHTAQFSSTSQLPSHDTRTFINPPAQQAAEEWIAAEQRIWIAAEQKMIARQEQQQPHMMAPGTRDIAAQEGEEPISTPGDRTRQRPESDKHPDQLHNEVSPEDLQSSTRRTKYHCPVLSCNKVYGRKDNLTKHLLRAHGIPFNDDGEPASMSSTIDDGPDEDTRSLGTSPSHPRSGMADHTSRDEDSQTHGGQTESSLRDGGQQRLAQAKENLDRLKRDMEQAEDRKQNKLQEKLELRKAKEEPDGSRKKKGEEEEEEGGGGIQLQDKEEEEEEKLLRAKYEETLKRLQHEGAKVKERNLNEEEKRIAKEVLKGEEEEIRRQEEERRTRRALAAKDARDPLRDTAKYQTETSGDPMPHILGTLRRAAGVRDESDYRHSAPESTASTQPAANPHEDVIVQKGKGAVFDGPEARMTKEEVEDEIRQNLALRFGRSKSEATNIQKRTSMHEGNEVIPIPSAHEELEGVEKPDRGTPPNRKPHIVPVSPREYPTETFTVNAGASSMSSAVHDGPNKEDSRWLREQDKPKPGRRKRMVDDGELGSMSSAVDNGQYEKATESETERFRERNKPSREKIIVIKHDQPNPAKDEPRNTDYYKR